jgi:hypothetical protein
MPTLFPAMKLQADLPTSQGCRKFDASVRSLRTAVIIVLKRKQMPGCGIPPGKPADRFPT